jgi:hypothetical protein
MCLDPATAMAAARFTIGTAQAIAGYGAKKEDAASLRAHQAQEAYNAEVARNQTWNSLSTRQMQDVEAGSQALFDNTIRAVKARATAETGAAEAGVQGNSIESVARGFYMEQGRIDASTERNVEMSVQQLQEDKKQAESQFRSRTNFPAIREPSVLDLGLQIGASGVNAFDLYSRRSKRPGTTTTR